MSLEAGTKFGPYEISTRIMTSDTGDVYKASDTRLNRAVALRLLASEVFQDPQMKERLEREAQMVASLNHPNICAIYDVGYEGGTAYVVMESLDGETLAERLEKGRLEIEEALKIAIAIADALDKAHRRGIAHRGLNPSSVLLTANGAKLLDFGLARSNPSGGPVGSLSSSPTRGTINPLAAIPASAAPYLAPEQWEGKDADARTDIFALGTILYEM